MESEKTCEFCSSEPKGRNFKFHAMVFSKRCIAWAKTFSRSFILLHSSVMASLGENWLLVFYSAQKNICQFRSSKPEGRNFKFDGMVFSKRYIGWVKNCDTSFMLWDWKATESLGKVTTGFQFSQEKNLWIFSASQRVEISNLMGWFFLKGTLVEPKTVRRVSCYDTEKSWKIWGKSDHWFPIQPRKKSVNFLSKPKFQIWWESFF